ncbi:MAG: DUF2946 family protein [Rhizomicrobium sp.]
MTRTIRFAALHVALAAMVLRALLPTGWMPNPAGAGSSPFTICTMDGPVHVQPLKQKPVQDDSRHHEFCPFGAAPHFATPLAAQAAPAPVNIAGGVESKFVSASIAQPVRYAPQSPRAPPAFA